MLFLSFYYHKSIIYVVHTRHICKSLLTPKYSWKFVKSYSIPIVLLTIRTSVRYVLKVQRWMKSRFSFKFSFCQFRNWGKGLYSKPSCVINLIIYWIFFCFLEPLEFQYGNDIKYKYQTLKAHVTQQQYSHTLCVSPICNHISPTNRKIHLCCSIDKQFENMKIWINKSMKWFPLTAVLPITFFGGTDLIPVWGLHACQEL